MTRNWSRTLRWPLWSWRNLTITSAAALALLGGLGRLSDSGTATADTTAHAATATHASTTAAGVSSQPALGPTATPLTAAQADPGASSTASRTGSSPVDAATGFVTAWAHKTSSASWHQGLAAWATPKLLAALAGTSPDQVPATQITGDGALITRTAFTAQVSLPTDGGRVAVTLILQGGTWKADGIAPDEQPPGATTPPLGPTPAEAG